jgi:transposase
MALGHDVCLMPPGYVKPYVKRNETDAADTKAIRRPGTWASPRKCPTKSAMESASAAQTSRVWVMRAMPTTMAAVKAGRQTYRECERGVCSARPARDGGRAKRRLL